jgi:hypothetical protein
MYGAAASDVESAQRARGQQRRTQDPVRRAGFRNKMGEWWGTSLHSASANSACNLLSRFTMDSAVFSSAVFPFSAFLVAAFFFVGATVADLFRQTLKPFGLSFCVTATINYVLRPSRKSFSPNRNQHRNYTKVVNVRTQTLPHSVLLPASCFLERSRRCENQAVLLGIMTYAPPTDRRVRRMAGSFWTECLLNSADAL